MATPLEDLDHRDKAVRRRAAEAVAEALVAGSLESGLVESLLAGGSEDRRWAAAFALGRAGLAGPRVLDAALAALASDDADVRWAAASLLIPVARTSPDLVASLRALVRSGDPVERKMAVFCLGECARLDGGTFLLALDDEDDLVRVAAMTALVRGGTPGAAALEAMQRVEADDPAPRVRRAAAAILQRLRGA